MALGNNSYNNNSKSDKKDYSPTTFSTVRLTNIDSSIDPTSLGFSYWKGMLKISIVPIKISGDEVHYDRDNGISACLTPLRASLLYNYLLAFKNNPTEYINFGINTRNAVLYITNGKEEFGIDDSIFFVIKSVDDSGNKISEIAYQFKTADSDYFGIVDYREGSNFLKDTRFARTIEFDMFLNVFKNYIDAVSGGYAATVVDATKYSFNSVIGKLTTIQENLGIDTSSKSKKNGYNASQFYNNNGGYATSNSSDYSDKIEEVDDYSDLLNS